MDHIKAAALAQTTCVCLFSPTESTRQHTMSYIDNFEEEDNFEIIDNSPPKRKYSFQCGNDFTEIKGRKNISKIC